MLLGNDAGSRGDTTRMLEVPREERRAAASPELRREVEGLRDGFTGRLGVLRDELCARYASANGGAPSLDELKRRLSEIAYLRTLLGDIEDAMGEGLRGTDHRH